MPLFAKQTNAGIPIFAITAEGEDVGTITNMPGEGVAFTVRVLDVTTTSYEATTIHGALEMARRAYLAILEGAHDVQQEQEEYIEDEDGEMAYMRMMEDRAERGANLWEDPW